MISIRKKYPMFMGSFGTSSRRAIAGAVAGACACGFTRHAFAGIASVPADEIEGSKNFLLTAIALPTMGVVGLCIVAIICALAGAFIIMRKGGED